MPGTARRGRKSAGLKKKETDVEPSDAEQTEAEQPAETDNADTTATELERETSQQTSAEGDIDEGNVTDTETPVGSEKNSEGAGNEEKEEDMSIDLEVKDDTAAGTGAASQEASEEAVEIKIESLPESSGKVTDTSVTEEKDNPVSTADSNMDTSTAEKSAPEVDVMVTADTTEPAGDIDGKDEVTITSAAESSKKDDIAEDSKTDNEAGTESEAEGLERASADTSQQEGTHSEPVTPVKEGDQSLQDQEHSTSVERSPVAASTGLQEPEMPERLHFPASLAKLRNLTVNIGPIRQMDLKSEKLHEILSLSDNFEIKFELKDKKDVHGETVQEKSGFVRLPFEITTPTFLIRVAHRLGSLHIDGRDMSVKFPEAFNRALDECKEYVEKVKQLRDERLEMKKRQISVKNVPPNVTEETIRSLFPEAQKITLNYEDLPDGGHKVGSILLDFDSEEACIQCLDTNKDVFIEDCQLKIFRLFSEKRNRIVRPPQYSRGRGFGRGRVMATRGGFQAAKIRKRALGFGNLARGKGLVGAAGRGGQMKKTVGGLSRHVSQTASSMKSPGAMGQPRLSPRGEVTQGRGQRQRSASGSRPGGYHGGGGHEGQFKNFVTPNRENTRGRRGTRPYRGRGSKGYQQRTEQRSPSFREHPRQSPHRNDRSPYRSGSSYRSEQRYSPSSSRDEDPRAMMEYLKSTIARMEEKITSHDYGDRGYDRRDEQPRSSSYSSRGRGSPSQSSSYSGRGRGSPSRGRGRGRGDQNRKRPSDTRDYGHEAKRPFLGGARRESVGKYTGDMHGDYRHDRDSSSHRGSRAGSHGRSHSDNYESSYRGGHGSSHEGSQGYRGGNYGDSDDRKRRDNYGGRSNNFNTSYSEGQFGSRGRGGGGRGQSRGRGYNKGASRGQLW